MSPKGKKYVEDIARAEDQTQAEEVGKVDSSCSSLTTPRSTPSTPRSKSPVVSMSESEVPKAWKMEATPMINTMENVIKSVVSETKSMDPLVDAIYQDAIYSYCKGKKVPDWIANEIQATQFPRDRHSKSLEKYR